MPILNEEKTLATIVNEIDQMRKEEGFDCEVLCIDDGSVDDTPQVCRDLAKRYSWVKYISHAQNIGKTAAIISGLRASKGDYLVLLESDGQYDPRDVKKLVDKIKEGYDISNGWRENRKDNLFRRIMSKTYNILLRWIFDTDLRDHNSGLKAFRKEAALTCFDPALIEKIGSNMRRYHRIALVVSLAYGLRVAEIPIRHFSRKSGRSYISPFTTPLPTFADIMRLAYRINDIAETKKTDAIDKPAGSQDSPRH